MERIHKIKVDYGSKDYYNNYKNSSNNTLSNGDYLALVTEMFSKLGMAVINQNYMLRMPHSLGTIMLVKKKAAVEFIDGKLVTNMPINYKATNDLWKENEEAKLARKIVYHDNPHSDGFIFSIRHIRRNAIFKNKIFYRIRFNRIIKRTLAKNVKAGLVDALLTNHQDV